MNKHEVGARYEQIAAVYLVDHGYKILERNFRCRSGEIDIIARDKKTVVFVEVKYRASAGYGSPLEAVTRQKQRKIIRVAQWYLHIHGYDMSADCRFDVVAIEGTEVTLIQNAFGCC